MDLGESLLARLSSLFHQDPLIDEVGLLFDIKQNDLTAETAFFLENHKLGVAFVAGTSLFLAARAKFQSFNAQLQQEATELIQSEDTRAQLLHCTRAILLINADFYTAWNTRKVFVTRRWLDAQDEMRFTDLVFALHPKSIDTWAYRRWLAARLCETLSGDDVGVFYAQQIKVSSRLAELKPRNYHAWSYRHWIVSRLPLMLLLKELDSMQTWCKTHISDHSGWNHRQHTLNELAKRYQGANTLGKPMHDLFCAEYKFVSKILSLYSTHEALWCHRRYVMQCLLKQPLREETKDTSFLLVLVSQVTSTLLDANPKPVEPTALRQSWDDTLKTLSNGRVEYSSVSLFLSEIEVSWKCGTPFARRYAGWCLARLRVYLRGRQNIGESVHDIALSNKLSSLASTLQRVLVEDSVLERLWQCTN
ncbi:hypothetical protein PsorP6_005849 [Peronosclerospora sorghi]|uniref:Uncharacterized protein n=1 Tax=Peronosclerospora sorghi TaxID=230839 RepID=A0ACC0W700_9STRA|nr:hypothetical protein PsorP6_005849 [Peronosclerospora sorghi]